MGQHARYPNPPYGALLTYSVGSAPAGDAKLALQIADGQGKQVRRLELSGDAITPGLHRLAWDLRGDPPAGAPAGGRGGGGRGGFGGRGGGVHRRAGALHRDDRQLTGDTFTASGKPVSFLVTPLPR